MQKNYRQFKDRAGLVALVEKRLAEGLTFAQVAKRLGLPYGMVYMAVKTARARRKAALGGVGMPEDAGGQVPPADPA